MFWSICTLESIYCSSEKSFLDNTAVWYTPIQCSCLNTCAYNYSSTKSCEESSNLFVHVWYYDLLRGAWTMGLGNKRLICNLLSQHRWWSILHFAFMLTWCFKKRLPVCVNAGYSSLWTFSCAQKLYPIYEHFQHPVYAHFIVVGMWLNHFQSPYILLLSACVLEAVDSRLRNPRKISLQGPAKAPLYNS